MSDSAWLIEGKTELVLVDASGEKHRVPAQEIWESESNKEDSVLPSLSSCDLVCSAKPHSLKLSIVPVEGGSFGCLELAAVSLLGDRIVLSPEHRSDHIVDGSVWHPIDDESLDRALSLLKEQNVIPGLPLSLGQYVAFARRALTCDWIENTVHPDSKEISEAAFGSADYYDGVSGFTGNLYSYQKRGSAWMSFMLSQSAGFVLGDCMGLGKTIQVIKVVCRMLEQDPGARILIVAPPALVENWMREFDKFSIGVRKEKHIGPNRTGDYRKLMSSVVITTYDIVRIDRAVIGQITWDLVVLDEAQNIKNPKALRTKRTKMIPRKAGIAVTGTPFENHMTDLWSIFDFCVPGALGDLTSFNSCFSDDDESARELGVIIAPLMLRRSLEDASIDLPDLVPIPMPIELDSYEAKLYDERRREYIANGATLGAINKLISDLAAPVGLKNGISNIKYHYLESVAHEVFENNEKLLVFSDKLVSIGAINRLLKGTVPVFTLTGADPVSSRQSIIDSFQAVDGAAVLIANPVVGGAGLNITEANHIVHFSPQWNPAKIDQADARAHRYGQKKTVFTHYPYYVSTIEEYMWDKVYTKRGLSEQAVVGNKGEMSANEILQALSMSPLSKEEQ